MNGGAKTPNTRVLSVCDERPSRGRWTRRWLIVADWLGPFGGYHTQVVYALFDGKGKKMYRYGRLLLSAGGALAQNADTVDWFDAYDTPTANALLALDGSAQFPISVIPDNSIPGSKLVPGAVTAGRLGNNSVTTDKISDGQVMEADLAAGSVTSSKIANDSVSYVKITNGTVRGEDMYVPLSMSGSRLGGIIVATNSRNWSLFQASPKGVYGEATGTGSTYGVYGKSAGSTGTGVFGYASSSSGATTGVYGSNYSSSGRGVYGYASSNSGTTYGVKGHVNSGSGYGCYGSNANGNYGYMGGSYAAYFRNANGNYGYSGSANYGVRGDSATNNGRGLVGICNSGSGAMGVWAQSTTGEAGHFSGDVYVSGDLDVAGSKNFKIDHPLDPENMYLRHSCVESSEMMNVYSGTVVLDARGEAQVQLPDWFEAVNGDFRYNLTPIGAPGPNLFIAQEIANGCFRIAGGVPGTKASWIVIAARQDPYALAHPFQVEEEKSDIERGSYLHPELYGQPETMGIEWATNPEAMMEIHGGG
jgi:hypothetical protein